MASSIVSVSDIDIEEPKYQLYIVSNYHTVKVKVSTAQVQFWEDYADNLVNSLTEHFQEKSTGPSSGVDILRVDLLTGNYHPDFVKNLYMR